MSVESTIEDVTERIGLTLDRNKYDGMGILFILPVVIVFLLVTVIPIVYGLWLSFNSGNTGSLYWVGISNYTDLLNSDGFYDSLKVGIIYALYTVSFQVILGTGIALALNKWNRGASVVRAFVFLPYMIPTVAIVTVAQMVLDPQIGILNWGMWKIGLLPSVDSVNWFSSTLAIHTISWVSIWRWTIFAVILILARLQSIDQTLYDMARVNGASIFRQFVDITYPSIKSVLLLVILLRGIWMFNKFDVIWLLTAGGPLDSTTTMVVLAYENGFNQFQFGRAAAITALMFVLLLVVGIIYFSSFNPEGEVDVKQ